jgi:heterodisulfide reductase subunit C
MFSPKRKEICFMPSMMTPTSDQTTICHPDSRFSKEVIERSGVTLNMCWSCLSCSGGCQFYQAMDYGPHRLIRMIQLGMWKEVLESRTIWLCVGCNTCAIACPNAVDVAALCDTLRVMAIERGVVIAEPDVLAFHSSVLISIKSHGRAHKLEIMLRYKLHKKNFLEDAGVGLKMLAKGKLDILPTRIEDIESIRQIFKNQKAA